MYESFYGLKEKPFTLLPDPEYLYLSPKHQRALTLLEYGMMNQAGFSVICGDTGAGKTTLIRRLLTELGDDTRVGLITNTHQSFGELLNWVLMAFGLDGDGKSKAQMHNLFIDFLIEQYAQNKHTVLIVDEAQNMDADTLEELRMLSNINADKDQVLQVILAGQPALRETLRKPELMQFAQRIAVDYYLESLSIEETRAYIYHRLNVAGAKGSIFTDDACNAIFKYSGGTPRLINLLCDTALVYGFAEQTPTINEQLVHDVVREQHSNSIIPTFNTEQPATEMSDEASVNSRVGEPAVNKWEAEIEQKVRGQNIDYEQQTTQHNAEPEQVSAQVTEKSNAEVTAGLNQSRAVPVDASDRITGIERAQNRSQAIEKLAEKAESAENNSTAEKQAEVEPTEAKLKESVEEINPVVENVSATQNSEKVEHVAPYMAQGLKDDEDVYPIVHIEENPRKGFNMVLLGIVTGMFIASIAMMAAAWMMFGSKADISEPVVQQSQTQIEQNMADKRELEALQKERDAAVAESKALERERDAALKAAKAQEAIRAAEMRAAEILAEQERRVQKRLQQARARTLEAERAEAKAREREGKLKLQAEKREAELEKHRLALLREERLRREAQVAEEVRAKRLMEEQRAAAQQQAEKVTETRPVVKKSEPRKEESFSANPCNSPSAKFLSTCKK